MNYGWISETGEFAKRPLLGKPCRDYVLAAMAEVEVVSTPDKLGKRKADMALVVREDKNLTANLQLAFADLLKQYNHHILKKDNFSLQFYNKFLM